MPQHLPRFYRQQHAIEDAERLARIILEAEANTAEAPSTVARVTLAGDRRRLRGIPAVSRGTSGAIPGTDPVAALLWKESRNGKRR